MTSTHVDHSAEEISQLHQAFVDSVPGLVAILAPSGELIVVNTQLIEYCGRGLDELKEWGTNDTVHPDDLPRVIETFSHAITSGEPYDLEMRVRRFDGVYRWFQVRGLPYRDTSGQIARWFSLLTDIDDLKRAQEELRRDEAFLAQGQRISLIGNWAWDVADGRVAISEELCRIFGFDPSRRLLTSEDIAARIAPRDVVAWRDDLERAIAAGQPYEHNLRIVLDDGTLRDLHTIAQPELDAAGRIVAVVGTTMDVTQRRRTERALRRERARTLKARYEAMLAERTRMARELHDTLLSGFTGVTLKLLAASHRMTLAPDDATVLDDMIGLAEKVLKEARRAIWDIRSEPGTHHDALLPQLRAFVDETTQGTGITTRYAVRGVPKTLPPAVMDAALRIAREAVVNTVKHAGARRLDIRVSFQAHRVRLVVADDGRGFVVAPDPGAYAGHWGLTGMRERAGEIGARLTIRSATGLGTRIALNIPSAHP
jgi:PAS domain S-box-containing protein